MSARYTLRPIGVYDNVAAAAVAPTDGAPWAAYEAWLAQHNVPDPIPVPPPPMPTPYDGHDFRAAGLARDRRQIQKLAQTDPLAAALLQGGITP